MDLDNIQRKYGLPAPLPVVQNGKFATRFPLNLEHRGDDVFQFGGKYIGEIENIYDLLYKILTNQEIDASLALPYAIKITEDKLYIRDKTNSEWILIFDITKPNFPKEIELYELIYKAITHQVIGEDTSYPGQFKIEENILYVRDKDNLTWTQIGDVTKEFLGATEATQDILDQVNEILTEVQELKTELNRQIATTNETLTTALQAANEAMTSAQSINIRTFNSVEEVKASNTLKAGALAKTLGFYTAGDGGGADYLITDNIGEDEADKASIISLQNELYAKLLIKDYINIKWFGAKGDGETDDTESIQKSFDLASKYGTKLIFPKAIYSVSKVTYNATVTSGNPANIEFNFATLKANTENEAMFEINSENFDGTNKQFRGGRINNLKVDCNNLSSLGVLVTKATNYTIDTLNIINVKDTGYKHVSGSGVTLQNAYASGYSPDVYTKGFLVHGDSVYRNIGTEDITVSVEEVSQGSRIDIINLHAYYSKVPNTPEIFKKSCCIKAYKNSNILASHVIADGVNSLFYLMDSNISVIGSNLDIHNAISPSEYPTYADDNTTTQYLFKYDTSANLDYTDKQNVSNLSYYCFTGTDTQKLSNIEDNFKGTVCGLSLKLDNINLQMSIPYSCNTGVTPYKSVILNTDFTNTNELTLTVSNISENSQYINASKAVGVKFKNMFNNSVPNSKFPYYRKLMQLISGSEATYIHINTEFDVSVLDDILSNYIYFFSTFYSENNSHMSLSIYLKNADGTNSTMISSGNTYFIQGNTAKTWVFPITLDKSAIFAWLQSYSDKEIKVRFEFNFEVPMNSNVYIKNFGFYTANSPYYAVPNI